MSLYTATNVDGVFTVVVDSLDQVNTLHFNPERMTAWQHCIVEFAIRGDVQAALHENYISNDQDICIDYASEYQLGWGDVAEMHKRIRVEVRF